MLKRRKPQISVLLAPGAEESDVLDVTRTLRAARFPVFVVGLTANPARGAHGLALAPDRTLNEVDAQDFQAVVLPGGKQGVGHLNADPRVHAFLRQVVACGGLVLALGDAEQVVQVAGVGGPEGRPDGTESPVLLGGSGAAEMAARMLVAAVTG